MRKFLLFSSAFFFSFLSLYAQVLNPDSKYPIPANYGDKKYEGVNLFTGTLNLEIPLADISGSSLSYDVNAFYTSRTASLINSSKVSNVDNELGGYGWKLSDYFKIYHDRTNNKYYFVDGQQQYLLTAKDVESNYTTYTADGMYCLWQFSIGLGYAAVRGDDGTSYYFQPANTNPVSGMNLWMIVNDNKTDTLTFRYNSSNNISSIRNIFGDSLYFHYNSYNRLSYIAKYSNLSDSGQVVPELTELNYTGSDSLLTFISYLKDTDLTDGITEFTIDNLGWSFSYYSSGFTNLLEIMNSPSGKKTVYTYKTLSINNNSYDVVIKTSDYNDSNVHDNKFLYAVENAVYSTGSAFTYFNNVTVYPGTKSDTSKTAQYFTSFESANPADDPLIARVTGVYSATNFAHSGSRSLNFGSTSIITDTRTIQSERLALLQSGEDYPDSLTVGYYWYADFNGAPGRAAPGNTYLVNIYYIFYDSDGRQIYSASASSSYSAAYYANMWNHYSFTMPVPVNAKTAVFEISQSNSTGFYYVDDLSITGTISPPNGKIAYNFLNSKDYLSLNGLPADYFSEITDENTTFEFFAGFESAADEEWLTLGLDHPATFNDLAYVSYLPVRVENGYNSIHSYEGDYALRMKARGNDTSHSSTISMKEAFTVPANTDKMLIQFQYTRPVEYRSMYLYIQVTINGAVSTYPYVTTGDYSKWPYFIGFSESYYVLPGDVVSCKIIAQSTQDNYLYLDNLSIRFINGAQPTEFNTISETISDPMFWGKLYSYRIFKGNDSELESSYAYYTAHRSPKSSTNKYIQTNRITNVTRGSARIVSNALFNDEGLLSSVQKTKYIRRTDDNTKEDTVLQKTEMVYAYEQYPDLGITEKNILTPVAAAVNLTSTDHGSTWEISDASYEQWTKWNSAGFPSPDSGRVWAPWRTFELKQEITTQQLNDVLNNFKNNMQYNPSADSWLYLETINARFPKNFAEASVTDLDNAITNTSYSNGLPGRDGKARHNYVPVSTFYNDAADLASTSANPSIYFGFETYEPYLFTSGISNSYAFTGSKSKSNGLYVGYKYDNSSNHDKKYLIGFWALAGDNSTYYNIIVEDNSGHQLSTYQTQSLTPGKWQYIERIFTLPANINVVNFRFVPAGTSPQNIFMDDIRIGPADAEMEVTVYDENRNVITAEIDNNANVTRYVYDQFNNRIAEIGNDYAPKSISLFDPERRKEINHSFASSFNVQTQFDIQGGGTYFNFKDISQSTKWFQWYPDGGRPGYVPSYINNTDGRIYLNKYSTFTYTPGNFISLKDGGISFTVNIGPFTNKSSGLNNASFVVGAENNNFGVLPRIQSGKYLIDYYLSLNGTQNYTVTDTVASLTSTVQQWSIVIGQTSLLWYVNGKLVQKITDHNFGNEEDPVFTTNYEPTNVIWVKDIIIFSKPIQQAAFIDGNGNTVQNQYLVNTTLVTRQTVYDEMNRPVLKTSPAALSGSFGYVSDFITSFSKHTGKMQGQVEKAADYIDKATDDDKYYMYDQTVYDNSPLNNEVEYYRPGAYYSMLGPDYENTQDGNFAKAINWLYYHKDQIIEVITVLGYAADIIDVVVNPEDPLAWIFLAMDVEGAIQDYYVEHHTSDGTPVAETPAVTSYYYNKNDQLILVKLPEAVSGDSPSQVITYQYDFAGNIIKMTSPESGITRNAYDDAGRLRFMQKQNDDNNVIYFKYNRTGDIIEKGGFTYNWSDETQAALEALANDPDYPDPYDSYRLVEWQYGDNQNSAPSRNRIHTAVTHNYYGNTITETYNYDNVGNVLNKTTGFNTLSNTFTVGYEYDNLGKVTQINYPSAGTISPLTVLRTYNDAGLISEISKPSNEVFADYMYNPDETVSYQQLYTPQRTRITNSRTYTAPGYMSETSYSNMFDYKYNYNYAGWFDNVRNRPQYGSFMASSQYDPEYPGSGNTFKTQFGYDENANLAYYQKTGYSHTDFDEYTLSYNKNNNFIKALDVYDSDNSLHFRDSLIISSQFNRITDQYIFRNDLGANSVPRIWDTTNVSFYSDGNIKKINKRIKFTYRGTFSSKDSVVHKNRYFTYTPDYLTNTITSTDSFQVVTSWNVTENRVNFDYQAYGDRKQKKVENYHNNLFQYETIKQYIHGVEDMPLAEFIQEKNNLNTITRKELRCYVYDDENVIAMVVYNLLNGSVSSYSVLTDQLGSVMQVSDRGGAINNVVSEYNYGAFGTHEFYGVTNPEFFTYRYTGQEYDPETGLYNYKVRFYDPSLKNFLSPDPAVFDPAMPYSYAANNPVNYTDPTGATPTLRSATGALKETERLIDEVGHIPLAAELKAEKNARIKYMGHTPKKNSKTGRLVMEKTYNRTIPKIVNKTPGVAPPDRLPRLKYKGKGRPNFRKLHKFKVYVETPKNLGAPFKFGDQTIWRWMPVDGDIDMGHITPAVSQWNNVVRKIKNLVKREAARASFMLSPKTYELEYGVLNSTNGAVLRQKYLPPAK